MEAGPQAGTEALDVNDQLELLRRQYLQLVDVDKLSIPGKALVPSAVQSLLYDQLFKPEALRRGPPERYQSRVLNAVISAIENNIVDPSEEELSDDLMSVLATFLASTLPREFAAAQQKAYVTYTSPSPLGQRDAAQLTLLESRALISASGTTGLRTWEAALHLGAFLMSTGAEGLVKEKNVVELGAGTGFVSVLCAKYLGANHVLATDGDERVLEELGTNLKLNGLESSETAEVAALRWGEPLEATCVNPWTSEGIDTVLGADITYDVTVIPALVSTLSSLLDAYPGIEVIIAATVRNEDTFSRFLRACRSLEYKIAVLPFRAPPMAQQRGFFHSTTTPLRIIQLRQAKQAKPPKPPKPALPVMRVMATTSLQ
ncbi:MAG: hypothetical protein M1832_000996 [Thelocarpon impressellum]|nr:MAG: hypothetical protein M1832_000996 [Thelocarpon impressellum]